MKSFDYNAVIVDCEIYCTTCRPTSYTINDYQPIFADSEWDYYPVCCVCGEVHDYVSLTTDGQKMQRDSIMPEEDKPKSKKALEYISREVKKLDSLLKHPELGSYTWWEAYRECMDNIVDFWKNGYKESLHE